MNTIAFIQELKTAGIRLDYVQGELKVKAAPGVVTAQWMQRIRSHKEAIIALLQGQQTIEIPKAAAAADYPLSAAQQSLWVACQDNTGSVAYHMPLVMHITAPVTAQWLQDTLTDMVQRHDALRTCFTETGNGFARQRIADVPRLELPQLNLAGADELTVKKYIHEEVSRPFALSQAPLMRALLITESNKSCWLVVTIHHLVADGASLQLLQQELADAFTALLQNRGVANHKPATSYIDYAVWQQAQNVRVSEKAYWTGKLQEDWPVIDLLPELKRPAIKTFNGSRQQYLLEGDAFQTLQQLCRQQQVSLFSGLLALVHTLIFRYTGKTDLVTGTIVNGRELEALQQTVGLFINTVPLRTALRSTDSFANLLQRQQQVLQEALAHQSLPFVELVQLLNKKTDISRSALFDILFVFNEAAPPATKPEGIGLLSLDSRNTSQYDITFTGHAAPDSLQLNIEYNTDIYTGDFIHRLWLHLVQLLLQLAQAPATAIGAIDYLTPAETAALRQWNHTVLPLPENGNLLQLIEKAVHHHSNDTAIVAGGVAITYHEAWTRINRLAAYLQQQGIAAGDRVGVLLPRNEWLPLALLAVLRAGAVYIPLDPAYPEERIRYIQEHSSCAFIITGDWLQHFIADVPQVPALVPVAIAPQQLAYIIYTSGSTGKPKGVCITHANVYAFIQWSLQEFSRDEVDMVYAVTSHCFDLSVFEFFYTLSAGKTMRVLPSGLHVADAIEQDSRVLLNTVPSLVQQLVAMPQFPWQRITSLNMAGEAVPPHFRQLPQLQPVVVRNLYGPTETTTYSTCYRFTGTAAVVPIGPPIANTQVYILDENRIPVPVGMNGEIYIAGAGVTAGYYRQPELTAERYLADPFVPGAMMFKTGDTGRWNEKGELLYAGRKDFQVKIRGYRIEPGEIEQVLESLPGVEKAVVQVRKNVTGNPILVAYIQAAAHSNVAEWKQQLQQLLPVYMQPDVFRLLTAMPLTPNGKVNRQALPWEEEQAGEAVAEKAMPGNVTEEKIYALWQEVLQHTALGVEDSFFESGANSLHAVRLLALLKQHWNLSAGIRFVFEHLTIRKQAGVLAAAAPVGNNAFPVAAQEQQMPVSSFQERIWIISRTEQASRAYHIPGGIHIQGKVDVALLQQAFRLLLQRHELLHAVFEENAYGEPYYTLQPEMAAGFVLPQRWLNNKEELATYIQINRDAPFTLQQAPLYRVQLLTANEQEHYLLYCFHHLICDGWSLQVIEKEWWQLYAALCKGEAPVLTPPAAQFRDFRLWESETDFSVAEAAWKQHLAGPLNPVELPVDEKRLDIRSFRGASVTFTSGAAEWQRLKNTTAAANATLFPGILSLLQLVLWKYSGQQDIITGMATAARTHGALDGMVGPLVNSLPVRTRIEPEESYHQLIQRVHKHLLAIYEHEQFPFVKLLDVLDVTYETGKSPLFDIMVVFQNQEQAGLGGDAAAMLVATGLQLSALPDEAVTTTQMDLSFIFRETAAGLQLRLDYNADVFAESYVQRLVQNFGWLLQQATQAPHTPVAQFSYVHAGEQEWLLRSINAQPQQPFTQSLVSVWQQQVAATPQANALFTRSSTFTYKQLNEYANRFAAFLQQQYQVQPGGTVCISLPRSEWLIVAILGILKTGNAYVPVDPAYPAERREYMIADSGCPVMVNEAVIAQFLQQLHTYSTEDIHVAIAADAPAYIIYTSGSTGNPKGVVISHANVLTTVKDTNYLTIQPSDVLLQWANYAFDAAVFDIFGALLNGAALVMMEDGESAGVEAVRQYINQFQVNVLFVTTAFFNLLAEEDVTMLAGIRTLLFGGELVSRPHVQKAFAFMGPGRLLHMYGPTETSVYGTFYPIQHMSDKALTVPVGKPVSGRSLYVLDSTLQPVPKGALGELYIGGAAVGLGYWNDPEKTDSRFIPNPFVPGEKMYRTGDLVRWQESGDLVFMGRIDHQVKIRGHRIELAEIEYHLCLWEGISDAVVTVGGQEKEDKFLCAYIAGVLPDESALRRHLKQVLPEYMVPACFVVLDALPLNANGKVDRKQLPAPSFAAEAKDRVAPSGTLQNTLWQLWCKVLRDTHFGVKEVFAELGGHSLKAGRLAAEIRKHLQVHLSIPELLHTSIEEQAFMISGAAQQASVAVTPAPSQPGYPLSAQQLGLFALELAGTRGNAFSIGAGMWLQGKVNVACLQQAVAALLQQHTILRTVYRADEAGEIRQWILPVEKDTPWLITETIANSANARSKAEESFQAFCDTAFDLQQAPLFQVKLISVTEEEHILALVLHHIASDGWGLSVIREDLLYAYSQALQGLQPQWEAGLQYYDFAVWQQNNASLMQLAGTFWQQLFAVEPAITLLPVKGTATEKDGTVSITTPNRLLQQLRQLAQELSVSVYTLAITAVNLLLHSQTGQEDITLGSPFAGRMDAGLDRVAGCFVNNLLIRNRIYGHCTIRDIIRQVQQVITGVYAAQQYPSTLLDEQLRAAHAVGLEDLNRVSVNYLNIDMPDSEKEKQLLTGMGLQAATAIQGVVAHKYDANFLFSESDNGLQIMLEYKGNCFTAGGAQQQLQQLQAILDRLVHQTDSRLNELFTAQQPQTLANIRQLAVSDIDDNF